MVREALRERFLETLKDGACSAGNARLRSELGWQEDIYWAAVHAALVEAGEVVAGHGRGVGRSAKSRTQSTSCPPPSEASNEITVRRSPR